MRITLIFFTAILLSILVLSSCKQKAGQQKTMENKTTGSNDFTEIFINNYPGLRDPSQVMEALEMAGADYIEGLVVPMQNVSYNVQDETQASLALGVYMVDVAYLATYRKAEEAQAKYERTRMLSKTIGIKTYYDLSMFEDYLTAGAHPDSLRKSLTLTAENVYKELTQMEKFRPLILFMAGEFVEKMYLATQVIKSYPTDLPEDVRNLILRNLILIVKDQEEPLDNLIDLLNQISEDDKGEKFIIEMNKLKKIYVEANFTEMIANWTPQTQVNGEYLDLITVQVERLRERIVPTRAQEE